VNCHILSERAESNLSCCGMYAIGTGDRETTSVCSVTFMATHTRTYASIKNVNMPALGQWLAADAIWRLSQSTCLRYVMDTLFITYISNSLVLKCYCSTQYVSELKPVSSVWKGWTSVSSCSAEAPLHSHAVFCHLCLTRKSAVADIALPSWLLHIILRQCLMYLRPLPRKIFFDLISVQRVALTEYLVRCHVMFLLSRMFYVCYP